jgi:hypothetical protein
VEGDPASAPNPTVDYEAPTDSPGEAGETAAGWGPVDDWGGIDGTEVAAYNPALWDETDWDSSGEAGSEFGSTDAWYGNDGYGH